MGPLVHVVHRRTLAQPHLVDDTEGDETLEDAVHGRAVQRGIELLHGVDHVGRRRVVVAPLEQGAEHEAAPVGDPAAGGPDELQRVIHGRGGHEQHRRTP